MKAGHGTEGERRGRERQGEEKVTLLWERYRKGRAYQTAQRMTTLLPRYVDFYEGRQWPPATKNTRDLPRPVINIIKMICRNKKSSILATPVRCVYAAADGGGGRADTSELNDFSLYIDKEMGMEQLDRQAVDSAVKKGTAIWHLYWDAEARGMDGRAEGGLRCELVDPLNCFFENPAEPDEQKQEWILFAHREPVASVRAKADRGVDLDLIRPDRPDGDPYRRNEQDGSELCTVLVCYFRHKGEVMVERAVKATIVNHATPITPDIQAARRRLDEAESTLRGSRGGDTKTAEAARVAGTGTREVEVAPEEDPANTRSPDVAEPDGQARQEVEAVQTAKSHLYPICVWQYEPREGSIYGIGEVEGLIPNQKAINFMYAMILLNAQSTGWNKWTVMPGALMGQTITNAPGQVLVDHTRTGNGIKPLTVGGMSGQPMSVVQAILQDTRTVTGSTEVMTGEALGASMSGAAIAQLQSQAQVPLEDIRNGFWLAKERLGKIKEQFFKTHYAAKDFLRQPLSRGKGGEESEVRRVATFHSADYADAVLEVSCEAMAGTKASAAGDISILETAYAKGDIDFRTLVEAYPKDALGNRSEILRVLEQGQMNELAMLREQAQQLSAQLEQAAAQIEADSTAFSRVQSLIEANRTLEQKLAMLYTEATAKLRASNEEIRRGNSRIQEVESDATLFAEQLAPQVLGAQVPEQVPGHETY